MSVFNEEQCINLLRDMTQKLISDGETRFPKKSDFSEEATVAIKAFLGPWPRALEKAGIKEFSPEKEQKKQKKRIESKRKKTLQKIESRKISK